ncbi:DUF4124 domain-containing protein [Agaribacterium sp. ZY112]|uniref:DUF4124 domain-containing protein n=1 Tax=Agaribacterium sp. ZY112 TaxID=3233574 RepID=UPI003524D347
MALLSKLLVAGNIFLISALISSAVSAGEYWRWQDEQGVTHYGSTPPQGVAAEKVTTHGDTAPVNNQAAASTSTAPQAGSSDIDTQKKQLQEQRKEECEQEKQRLQTLKSSGSRIRMKSEDGTTRFLTPDEIAQEIQMSNSFLKDACSNN